MKTIVYYFRGHVERGSKRGYVWREGYSPTAPGGGVQYPWMTKRECQADAKAQGTRAVFSKGDDK